MLKIIKNNPLTSIVVYFALLGVVLSFFTNTLPDETKYLHETKIIADCFSNYEWFGNEAVGTHGFLFKIPVALLFTVFGTSYFIAEIFNLLLVVISIIILYKICFIIFDNNFWTSLSVFMFFSSYQSIKVFASYTREFPALLALLIFFFLIIQRKNYFFIGLAFLLVHDAKEYVSFIFSIPLIAWIIVDTYKMNRNSYLFKILNRLILVFIPTIVYLFLMLYTSLVPFNSTTSKILMLRQNSVFTKSFGFGARTVPFIRSKENYNKISENRIDKNSIDPSVLTTNEINDINSEANEINDNNSEANEINDNNSEANKINDNNSEANEINGNNSGANENSSYRFFKYYLIKSGNWVIKYISKVFSPRFLDYTSIPLFLVVFSIIIIKRKFKEYNSNYILRLLTYYVIVYLIIYILRDSFSRYLFHAMPFISIFTILFFKDSIEKNRNNYYLIVLTLIIIFIQFKFDYFMPYINICLSIYFTILVSLIFIRSISPKIKKIFILILIVSLSLLTTGMRISGDVLYGTINETINYGFNSEYHKISQYFSHGTRYWFNGNIRKLSAYIGARPTEKTINRLNPIFPKFRLVKRYEEQLYRFQIFPYNNSDDSLKSLNKFKNQLEKNKINKIAFLLSEIEGKEFSYQNFLPVIMKQQWIEVEKVLFLRNKRLYILNVLY
jgi:hypothetical protein